jgi:hypothetical protein
MPVYVCNFCGGDHGATECREQVCRNCYRTDEKCSCRHIDDEDCMIQACEAIDQMYEDFESAAPDADWDTLNEQFGEDSPIEYFRHVVATCEIAEGYAFLKGLFPPPKGDGKVYNTSRKYGDCYKWAYRTLLDGTASQLDDGDAHLVHGFVKCDPKRYIGHAWIETDNVVIDCGGIKRSFDKSNKDYYYETRSVQYHSRYSRDEVDKHVLETGHFGPWTDTPDDLPMATET